MDSLDKERKEDPSEHKAYGGSGEGEDGGSSQGTLVIREKKVPFLKGSTATIVALPPS